LIYACERALTGSIELGSSTSSATIVVAQGLPTKVRTSEEVFFLGSVLEQLGMIDEAQLKESLDRLQESPKLQGQILVEMGAITPEQLELGLREQLERKLEHLFTMPGDGAFAYYDGVNLLSGYGGEDQPGVDPYRVLWTGIRQAPSWEHVDAALQRVGQAGIRLAAHAQVERFGFGRQETMATELLRAKPMRLHELVQTKVLAPSVAQLFVYCLMITKQADLIELPKASPSAPPAQPRASAPPIPAAPPVTAPGQAPPEGPQAFARVKLQPRARPVVAAVEEHAVQHSRYDERLASPLPQAYPIPQQAPAVPAPPPVPGSMPPAAPIAPPIAAPIAPPVAAPVAPPAPPTEPMIAPPVSAPAIRTAPAAPPPLPPQSASKMAAADAVPPSRPMAQPTAEQAAFYRQIVARADGIGGQNYYEMLGVKPSATKEDVQKAFFTLAKIWHPDRLPSALSDARDACSKVFSHMSEAHATLTDEARRRDYDRLIKDGGGTPDEQAQVQAVLEAAQLFQKCDFFLKKNDPAQAEPLARKAYQLDPEQVEYEAVVIWFDAQRPENMGREKTLEKIGVLDRAIKKNGNCERAFFFRGMLHKRIENMKEAMKDFKTVADMNPRNLEAMREIRLYNMRKPSTAPGKPGPGGKKGQEESLGGLFGKLFKK
jgi:tetratricopeptide (TPR) repeat protein